jgi:hypothetical protein
MFNCPTFFFDEFLPLWDKSPFEKKSLKKESIPSPFQKFPILQASWIVVRLSMVDEIRNSSTKLDQKQFSSIFM